MMPINKSVFLRNVPVQAFSWSSLASSALHGKPCSLSSCLVFLSKIRLLVHPPPSPTHDHYHTLPHPCAHHATPHRSTPLPNPHPCFAAVFCCCFWGGVNLSRHLFSNPLFVFLRQGVSHSGVCGDQERCRRPGGLPVPRGLFLHQYPR